jgi:signal transduction histidine kinase
MAATHLLKRLSLRIALTYAVLFAGSIAAVLYVLYWMNVLRPLEMLHREVETEASTAVGTYLLEGPAATRILLERRSHVRAHRKAFHLLVDAHGRVLTSNLPSWPKRSAGGWARIEADIYREGEEDDYMALVYDQRLPDGARLIVGRDVESIDQFSTNLRQGALAIVGSTLVLGLLGGLVVSGTIGRRIDEMSRTARRVIAGDLTERVPVSGTGDDFDELATTLNLMLSRIEELFESVRRVSDSIAHELRTPLARLQADLDDLRQSGPGEAGHNALIDEAIAEASRLQSIFSALLRIARIESGRHGVTLRPIDLTAIVSDAIDLFLPEIEGKNLALTVDLPPRLLIEGDSDLLFQAVSNLLDNAAKFTPAGGTLCIAGERGDAGTVLAISDSGPGIPAEARDRVFERFFRLPATSKLEGAGLGLALVRAVVSLHGGEIELADAGPGLTVRLTFRSSRS